MSRNTSEDVNEADAVKAGDAILKRMLQTKPKTHDELVKGRHVDDKKRDAKQDRRKS